MNILAEWLFRPVRHLTRTLYRLKQVKHMIVDPEVEQQRRELEAYHSKDLDRFLQVQQDTLTYHIYYELGRWPLDDGIRHDMAQCIAASLLARASTFIDAHEYVAAQKESQS